VRPAGRTAALARAALVRAVVLAALWWAVSEGAATSLGLAAVTVAAATASSLWLQPPGSGSPRLRRLPGFLGWFVARSALGGVDVARRALRRRVDVDPGTVDVAVRLPEGLALVTLADAVSLLPGTLAVELLPGAVRLHVLDVRAPVADEVAELERRLADLYGVDRR
jgi:multicomponent Na+:H+ antiporter subunit E